MKSEITHRNTIIVGRNELPGARTSTRLGSGALQCSELHPNMVKVSTETFFE